MNITTILYSIIVMPIQIIYEIIFNCVYTAITYNYGVTIIVLSLVVNILVLPLYKRADAIQAEERDIEAKLKKGVDHIKKSFKGNEQTMILQAYYRENNYKPTYVIKGLLPLLLQIPFFIAAYNFLSHYEALNGVSFGLIQNLGAPDQMLTIFGITINVLPILMTLINFVSSYIYTRGFPLKNKIQLYGMAIIFLVLLYNSPAGLVFYWTLNNLFSLVKNIFEKLPNKRKIFNISSLLLGIVLIIYGGLTKTGIVRLAICGVGTLLFLPLILSTIKAKDKKQINRNSNSKLFFLSMLFISILVGLVIPSSVISSSPQEFVILTVMENPLEYLINSFSIAIGMFVVWCGVFYLLSNTKVRSLFDIIAFGLCITSVINYLFFGNDLGTLNTTLKYQTEMSFTSLERYGNLLLVMIILVLVFIVYNKISRYLRSVLIVGLSSLVVLASLNIVTIKKSIDRVDFETLHYNRDKTNIPLSKNGKNVIIITFDRAMGLYTPFIFKEKPELIEKFSGFTFYPNTISYSGCTNTSSPSEYGGYEYTPIEMNKRDTEKLVDKHNEALKMMPTLFSNEGYKVTVCDAPYANYMWIPDMSIFEDIKNVNSYRTVGEFSTYAGDEIKENNMRNFFCYGLTKSLPVIAQGTIYDKGVYNYQNNKMEQVFINEHKSKGYDKGFIENYDVMVKLPELTKISDSSDNTLLILENELPHEAALLQKPNYVPSDMVDNTEYDGDCYDNYIIDGFKLPMENKEQITHYHSNMASMIKLGEWFDYLKANDVYDNTRIIIVSDHGRDLHQLDDLVTGESLGDGENLDDLQMYLPLLMVKDFNTTEFTVSDEFMTVADVPTLATKDLIINPTNPFTGKAINSDAKQGKQYIFGTRVFSPEENNGNTFKPDGVWYSVEKNPYDKNNWQKLSKNTLFPE